MLHKITEITPGKVTCSNHTDYMNPPMGYVLTEEGRRVLFVDSNNVLPSYTCDKTFLMRKVR